MGVSQDFKIIYHILKNLEKSMDYEEYDIENIRNKIKKKYEITDIKYNNILCMLLESGYISGINSTDLDDFEIIDIKITIKGLEYLQENSMMKKVREELTGIAKKVVDKAVDKI